MMADFDSNMIKPVEGLQNITGLAPARRREQRSRRQQLHEENENREEQKQNESTDEKNSKNLKEGQNVNINGSSNRIDYRA
jgi:hypothetical protein